MICPSKQKGNYLKDKRIKNKVLKKKKQQQQQLRRSRSKEQRDIIK
jgi:hypothetical protein